MTTERSINRRQFMAGVAGAASVAMLAACSRIAGPASGGVSGADAAASANKSALPTYAAITGGPTPDYPSAGPLYEDAFVEYPANPVQTITAPPGTGSTVNIMTIGLSPAPTPYDNNPAWKAVNQALNANVQFNIVLPADYNVKMGTTMAGGDLPDMIFFYASPTSSSAIGAYTGGPQFVQSAMQDLTPYLAGENAKNYPNLAAIPTQAWINSGSVYQGKLWMVPVHRFPEGFGWFKNDNIYDTEIGTDYQPKDIDDFKRVLLALTNPQQNRWAVGQLGLINYVAALFGAPNNWRVESSGKLTKTWETKEFRDGLTWMRDMYAAGVFHPKTPDYLTTGVNAQRTDFALGNWVIWTDQFNNAWQDFWRQGLQAKGYNFNMIPPFSAASNIKPQNNFGGGFLGATALKKAPDNRVRELLAILNYMAAPFGSREDLLLTSGIKDVDYNLDQSGNPILTKQGNTDANNVPWKYVTQHPAVIYSADLPNFAKAQYDAEHQVIPIGVADPTFGLISNMQLAKGFTLQQTITDTLNGVILGRQPLTDFDQAVKDYFASGGEQIRTEFQDALAGAST
jgi:putative aldouronate transport system substrate-binding protein